MRKVVTIAGSLLLVVGAMLVFSLFYDAGDLTNLLGYDPQENEAAVALVGLASAALVLAAGFKLVRQRRALPVATDAA